MSLSGGNSQSAKKLAVDITSSMDFLRLSVFKDLTEDVNTINAIIQCTTPAVFQLGTGLIPAMSELNISAHSNPPEHHISLFTSDILMVPECCGYD